MRPLVQHHRASYIEDLLESLGEVGLEHFTLVALHLAMLNWSSSQHVIQFHGLVGGHTCFIL